MNRLRNAAGLLLFGLMPLIAVQACGPDFFPDVFVRKLSPGDPKEFAQGKLGLLLPTYTRVDLAVAFRYLNGGALNAEEQSGYLPVRSDYEATEAKEPRPFPTRAPSPEPKDLWKVERSRYPNPFFPEKWERRMTGKNPDGSDYDFDYPNCLDDAFKTATQTLQARATTWGPRSPELANWLTGQDAVFSNCSGSGTMPTPAAAPALLRADRAYQIAAAHFYATDFPAARAAFEAIHQDATSPWQPIAGYLTARCLVRQAFLSAPLANYGDFASFNAPLMNQAADLLHTLLKEPNSPEIATALRNELDMVRFRTEPAHRLSEVAAALSDATHDPDYAQHLQDLDLVLNMRTQETPIREDTYISPPDSSKSDKIDRQALAKTEAEYRAAKFNAGYQKTVDLRANAPLTDWLLTFQSPSDDARTHAIDEWHRTHQLPWLIAAISKARPGQTSNAALLYAASQIAPASPAWETVTYHRARLLLALNRAPEARQLLDRIYPEIQTRASATGSGSTANAFLGLRLRAAPDLAELLKFAPQQILERTSESQFAVDECIDVMKDPKRKYDCKPQPNPTEFSADAASFFNNEAPLSVLVDATTGPALSEALPPNLRQSLAMTAWVRSVLLKEDAAAARLLPLLPAKLQQQAAPATTSGATIRPVIALVRNPGLTPYLDPGVQRAYSYDFVESYRDNWWCGGPNTTYSHLQAPESWSSTTIPAAMLSSAQRSEAQRQLDQIAAQGSAQVYLGNLVLTYANAHPTDPDVPEDLYLVLRMIRYGCSSNWALGWDSNATRAEQAKQDDVKQSAARLLRQRYRTSPWTKKAAPIM